MWEQVFLSHGVDFLSFQVGWLVKISKNIIKARKTCIFLLPCRFAATDLHLLFLLKIIKQRARRDFEKSAVCLQQIVGIEHSHDINVLVDLWGRPYGLPPLYMNEAVATKMGGGVWYRWIKQEKKKKKDHSKNNMKIT